MDRVEELEGRIRELEAQNKQLRSGFFRPSNRPTVLVPEPFEPLFEIAQNVVAERFSEVSADPTKGVIEIGDERYLLIRASALSLDFLDSIQDLYSDRGQLEAFAEGSRLLFDIAHTIGMKDAAHFSEQTGVTDPIAKLSAGPVHFAYSGWALVDIKPQSSPTPDSNFVLVYDHPYSFEADSWLRSGRHADCPVCIMNAGYSSGWCQESFEMELTAVEVQCKARGDEACTFVMAPPTRIADRVLEFFGSAVSQTQRPLEIPTYFARKQMEQALLESEQRYRVLVEHAPEAIVVLDPESGKFIDFNDNALELFGMTGQQLADAGPAGVSPERQPDGRFSAEAAKEKIQAALRGESPRFEWTHQRADGADLPCEVRLVRLPWKDRYAIRGSLTDISARVRAQEEKNRLATALEQAAETIIITNNAGEILHVNPAFERVTGYTREEVLGQTPRILRSGKHSNEFYEQMWSTISSGRVWTGRTINRKKDGSLFEEEGTISPVRDGDGRIVNYVAVKRDISREAELERRLAQSQKMEAIGTLAGGIAHDLNNMLCPILGFSEMLSDDADDSSEVRFNAAQISAAARKAAQLVSQILTFSRKEKRSHQPIHLRPVVEETLGLLRRSLPSTTNIVVDLQDCRPVSADPTQIQQILLNLGTNAQHAMRSRVDGELRVSLKETALTRSAAATWGLEPGAYALLTVSDNGRGMDEATARRIFEPYFTTKALGEGTGLGLATVHGIVQASGGHIEVQSRPQRGTQFRTYLPLSKRRTVAQQQPPRDRPTGQERILLVDDETSIVMLLRRGLEKLGYEVTSFTDSREALQRFQSEPNSFDVVITDQTMPQLTGIELAQKMLELRPGLPIVLSTGYSDSVDRDRAIEFGIGRYLTKPTTPTTIARSMRELIDSR